MNGMDILMGNLNFSIKSILPNANKCLIRNDEKEMPQIRKLKPKGSLKIIIQSVCD